MGNKIDGFYLNTNIKYLRKKKKESQEQLAKIINKKGNAIGKYEKGIRNPDYVDIYYIAMHFGVSIEELIKKDFRKEEKNNVF